LIARGEKNSFAVMRNRIEEKDKLGKTKRKDTFIGYRKCFLLKICLNNGKWFYLLEIERKDNIEGFSGLLLKPDKEFNETTLQNKILKIIDAKGILKNINFKSKSIIFKHYIDKKSGSMENCFLKNFKRLKQLFI
jgi:hypothetical protein